MLPVPAQDSRSGGSREITSAKGSVSEQWRRAEAVPRVRLGRVAWSAFSSGQGDRKAPRQGTLVMQCRLPGNPKWKFRIKDVGRVNPG
jgi:hypothetical protein